MGVKVSFLGKKITKQTPRSSVCAKKAETGEKKRQLLAYKNGVFLGLNELVFSKKKTVACGFKKSQKNKVWCVVLGQKPTKTRNFGAKCR